MARPESVSVSPTHAQALCIAIDSGTLVSVILNSAARDRLNKHLAESVRRSEKLTDVLTNETDRGCALVAGGILDDRLLELLRARMIERATVGEFNSFFQGLGPLSTFAVRTNLAYLVGFIANNVYEDLCAICSVRDRLGNSPEDLDFKDDQITTHCAKLHHYLKQRVSDNPRAQFVCAVSTIDTVLEYLIFDSEHVSLPVDGPEELSEILGRQRGLYAEKMMGIPPK